MIHRVVERCEAIRHVDSVQPPLSLLVRGVAPAKRDPAMVIQDSDGRWREEAAWSCVTGQAQMANNWLRLHEMTGDARWIAPAARSLAFVKRTQDRGAAADGVRGGIPGSWPAGGEYGRYEMLSWAAKFFADGLMRLDAATAGGRGPVGRLA